MPYRPIAVLTVAAAALAIAACGSSSKSSHSAALSQGIQFTDCMRSHGVPGMPDPTAGGGGIQIEAGSSISPASPSFQAAQKVCQSLMPGGGPGSRPPATKQQVAAMLHLSQCMRAHGVAGFPDPTKSPPANPAGFALAFGRPGAVLVIPDSIDIRSPTFKQAAQVCQFPGAKHPTPG